MLTQMVNWSGGALPGPPLQKMKHVLLLGCLVLCACTSARLSHDEARKKIAEIGRSNLVPDAIEIRRIVSQSETQAIAEATITLAFQFKRDTPNAEWRIQAVRLGDRDWISLDELLAGINEGRRRTTTDAMQKVADSVQKDRRTNGALPHAPEICGSKRLPQPRYRQATSPLSSR